MDKRRIFIAINLPVNIKNKLVHYQTKWTDLPVRWTIKPNLHVTLLFIGHVGEDETYKICETVKQTVQNHQPFIINIQRIILGPPGKFPRMFWVEGEKSKELANLKNNLEKALLATNSGYNQKEVRAYRPHITLGRIKQNKWKKLDSPPEINQEFKHNLLVETVEVMQSNLKRTGAEYSVLETARLG